MQTHLYLHKENTDIPSFQYRGKYLLKHFDYDLSRSVGRKGEITSGVCGGEIRIVIDGFADAVLLTWLFDTDEIEEAHSSVYNIFGVVALLEKQHIGFEKSEGAKRVLAYRGFTPKYGARQVAGTIRNYIRRPVSKMIVGGTLGTGNTVVIDVDANEEITWNVK